MRRIWWLIFILLFSCNPLVNNGESVDNSITQSNKENNQLHYESTIPTQTITKVPQLLPTSKQKTLTLIACPTSRIKDISSGKLIYLAPSEWKDQQKLPIGNIFIYDLSNSNIMQLTSSKYGDYFAAISNNGDKIAFVSYREDSINRNLYIMELSHSGPINILDQINIPYKIPIEKGKEVDYINWSPDDKWIAYNVWDGNNSFVEIFNIETRKTYHVNGENNAYPNWLRNDYLIILNNNKTFEQGTIIEGIELSQILLGAKTKIEYSGNSMYVSQGLQILNNSEILVNSVENGIIRISINDEAIIPLEEKHGKEYVTSKAVVSPDKKWILYTEGYYGKGIMKLMLYSVEKEITYEIIKQDFGYNQYLWSSDSKEILFINKANDISILRVETFITYINCSNIDNYAINNIEAHAGMNQLFGWIR
jgi:dipeptidyl aminopeptidase/acylaminoacyl peptidase